MCFEAQAVHLCLYQIKRMNRNKTKHWGIFQFPVGQEMGLMFAYLFTFWKKKYSLFALPVEWYPCVKHPKQHLWLSLLEGKKVSKHPPLTFSIHFAVLHTEHKENKTKNE